MLLKVSIKPEVKQSCLFSCCLLKEFCLLENLFSLLLSWASYLNSFFMAPADLLLLMLQKYLFKGCCHLCCYNSSFWLATITFATKKKLLKFFNNALNIISFIKNRSYHSLHHRPSLHNKQYSLFGISWFFDSKC